MNDSFYKIQKQKENCGQVHLIKNMNFCSLEDSMKSVRRQLMSQEKILSMNVIDKDLVA